MLCSRWQQTGPRQSLTLSAARSSVSVTLQTVGTPPRWRRLACASLNGVRSSRSTDVPVVGLRLRSPLPDGSRWSRGLFCLPQTKRRIQSCDCARDRFLPSRFRDSRLLRHSIEPTLGALRLFLVLLLFLRHRLLFECRDRNGCPKMVDLLSRNHWRRPIFPHSGAPLLNGAGAMRERLRPGKASACLRDKRGQITR